MYDLVIKNGIVVDPGNRVNKQSDIAVQNGNIVTFNKNIEARQSVDASGCYIVPGLIDFHLHLAPLAEIGVNGELACFPSGVTTAVDCGSSGAGTYEGHRAALCSSKLNVKAFLHVCSAGLATGQYHENVDPRYWDRDKIRRLFREYPNELLGLKIRMGSEIVGALGMDPLYEAVRLAEELNVPLMVHCSNPPSKMADILSPLKKGDILTHAFQDRGYSLLDEDRHIIKEAYQARERGVIFDVANANIHFSFAVAKQALLEGFLPDIISTDLTTRSLFKRPAVFNLAFVLSKYINLGMSLEQVVACATINPARLLAMSDCIGNVAIGSKADIAILKVIEHNTMFGDRKGEIIEGKYLLKPMLTCKNGELVYRDIEF